MLVTTVIGSYPAAGSDPIRAAVEDQLSAGVMEISDGQTRYDMITAVVRYAENAKPLEGGKFRINDRLGELNRELFKQEMLKDFCYAQRLAARKADVAAMFAGPVTLVFSSQIGTDAYGKTSKAYRNPELYMDMAKVVLKQIELVEEEGPAAIHIDEPYLSVGAPMDLAREAIEFVAKGIKRTPVYLHVCGDVEKLYPALLDFEGINVLSHAYMGNEANRKIMKEHKFSDAGKTFGLGCINTASPIIESADEVAGLVKEAIDAQGDELIVHPDCGMRGLDDRGIALQKLKVMCDIAKRF